MRDSAINLLRRSGSRCLFTLALVMSLIANASQVQAQDLFGFFRLLFQPTVRAPVSPSYHYRAPLRRPRLVQADQPSSKPPLKPKPLGEIANPFPELLADSTLRRGDFVMFPDGLRVFRGQSGTHTLADFEPVSGRPQRSSPGHAEARCGLASGLDWGMGCRRYIERRAARRRKRRRHNRQRNAAT